MEHPIEEFASIFAFGNSNSSTEEGDLCCEISNHKDCEYDEIYEAAQFLGLKYQGRFWKTGLELLTKGEIWESKKKMMSYILSRCMKLSENPTLFSFVAVCAFIDTVIFCSCNEIECFKIIKLASKCLIAAFHRRYVEVFDKENGFKGFINYCRKLNATVLDPSKNMNSDSDEDCSDNEDNLDLEGSDTNSEDSLDLEGFTPPDTDLTDFEIKLLYDLDELPLEIDPAEDLFIPLVCSLEEKEIENLDLAMQNMKIESNKVLERVKQRCSACEDNCYKYVVFVAKELGICEK